MTDPDATDPASANAAAQDADVQDATQDAAEQDDAVIGRAFRGSLFVVGAIAILGAGAWWWWQPARVNPPPAAPLGDVGLRPTTRQVLPRVPFTDITTAAGIDFVHENGARGRKLLPETMGGGVAFLDYDGDRDPDLLFVNGRPWEGDPPRAERPTFPTVVLYENDGRGSFDDVTRPMGLGGLDFHGMGVAAGDYDGDGRLDLFVSGIGENHLLRNTGERFEDVTAAAGLVGDPADWSTGCGWFDFDRDGDLDLFVCNYLDWTAANDATQDFTLRGGGRAYGRPTNFGGAFCRLYENDGAGAFTDVSERAGILVRNPDTGVPMAKALGLTFADFDDDGWLDVFVANDTVRNFLFHNQRDGTFAEIGALSGVAFDTDGRARGGMGTDVAHFRDDGAIGVAIGNFADEMTALYVSRPGAMQFDDDANANGLGPATRVDLTFGTLFVDADLDGRPDLFSVNGHLEEDIALVQSTQTYEQPPRLFWNAGAAADVEFRELPVASVGEAFAAPLVGRGCASADIDGDGDEDLVIATCGRAPRLLRNEQALGHHWLRLEFEAPVVVGTAVEVTLPNGAVLRRRVIPTRSYLSQCEVPLAIGLGRHERVERLTIRWPDGREDVVVPKGVDRRLLLRPGDGS